MIVFFSPWFLKTKKEVKNGWVSAILELYFLKKVKNVLIYDENLTLNLWFVMCISSDASSLVFPGDEASGSVSREEGGWNDLVRAVSPLKRLQTRPRLTVRLQELTANEGKRFPHTWKLLSVLTLKCFNCHICQNEGTNKQFLTWNWMCITILY